MYVNHEFRIKFLALCDIKAGEELFFNYGEDFPNLTKKLVERNHEKAADKNKNKSTAGPKRKGNMRGPIASRRRNKRPETGRKKRAERITKKE